MSHDLEQHPDGSTAFVAGHNLDAWHQLGTVLCSRVSLDGPWHDSRWRHGDDDRESRSMMPMMGTMPASGG